jgi:hypothetical protein
MSRLHRRDVLIRAGAVAGLVILSGENATNAGDDKPDPKATLDAAEEKVVREAVYNMGPLTASPRMDFISELVLPDSLVALHKKKPQAVLNLLLVIMEGASPKDSVLAAGYAISLLTSPAVGVVCIDHFDKNTYDSVHRAWETTPRKHWLKKVRAELKKKMAD